MPGKYSYYLTSTYELVAHVRPLSTVLGFFLHITPKGEKIIRLPEQDLSFSVRGAMDIWSVKETFIDRFYERFGTQVGIGWNIIDIGGGIGDFTTFAARMSAKNQVYAFEPTPHSYSLLKANLARNGILNAQAFPEAIWSETGELWMDTTIGEPGQFTSSTTSGVDGRVAVKSISLADIFQRIEINHCDLLKMDCEGAEYTILYNAPDETMRKIQRIVMEYHDSQVIDPPSNHQDLANYLTLQGYQVKTFPNYVHHYLGYLYAERVE